MIVQRKESSERVDVMKKLIEGDFQNLISTDLGSRGLDLPGIEFLFLFFPHFLKKKKNDKI